MIDEHVLTRRQFLQAGLGVLASAAMPSSLDLLSPLQAGADAPLAAPDQQPNLVYIFADQLRACSVGCYQNDEVSTPHIDQLASQGALFANAVSTSPLCGPHRACLMTGRYPTVTGIVANDIKLPLEEVGIAEVFRDHGYLTQYTGKWHLNGETPDPAEDPGWVEPEDRQGFEKWLAFNFSHAYYDGKYYWNDDPTLRTIPEGQYEPDFQTDRVIQFITNHRDHQFCLFLSIGTPHMPAGGTGGDLPPGGDYEFPYDPDSLTLRPNVDYPDPTYSRQEYADYYGIVSNFDWNVGRILDTLETLGLAQSTIVVVSSDHGDFLGSQYSTLGVFRSKGKIYAESLDVPFILCYPQMVAPVVVNDAFTSVDIMPTLLGLCGLPVPEGVMGRDFSPLLISGEEPVEPPHGPVPSTESAFVGMFRGDRVEVHTPEYSLAGPGIISPVNGDWSDWVGVRTPEYSLECARATLLPTKLYHNTEDPYQMTNLVDDPAYEPIKNALYEELLDWLDYVEPAPEPQRVYFPMISK